MLPWYETLLLLFGILTVLLLIGLPAAFAFLAINLVGDQLRDGDEAQPVLPREALQLRSARHGAVRVQDLADDARRREPGQASEVHGGLGLPDASQDAAGTRPEREDVTGAPEVRSYAAAPLVTRDGHHLGALCVFDREPRDFAARDLENLADLASMIMRELELRRASRRALFAQE